MSSSPSSEDQFDYDGRRPLSKALTRTAQDLAARQQDVVQSQQAVADNQKKLAADAAAWRKMNREVTQKNTRKHATHEARIDQLHANLKTQMSNHDALHERVGEIEKCHTAHKNRLDLLEQRHSDHVETLQQILGQNKWLGSVVAGIGITGGLALIVWMGSKHFGKKKGGKDDVWVSDDKTGDGRRRTHSRAWKIAPEVRNAGNYSHNLRGQEYYMR